MRFLGMNGTECVKKKIEFIQMTCKVIFDLAHNTNMPTLFKEELLLSTEVIFEEYFSTKLYLKYGNFYKIHGFTICSSNGSAHITTSYGYFELTESTVKKLYEYPSKMRVN